MAFMIPIKIEIRDVEFLFAEIANSIEHNVLAKKRGDFKVLVCPPVIN